MLRGFARRLAGLPARPPVVGGSALLLSVALLAASQVLPGRLGAGPELYCEVARGSFERTSKWARDLAATLEALDVEGPDATTTKLVAIRHGLEQEASLLTRRSPPAGAEEVQARGAATLELLIQVADPAVVQSDGDRESVGAFIREQFLAARGEARAAAAALRQHEPHCPNRRPSGGVLQLLGLG